MSQLGDLGFSTTREGHRADKPKTGRGCIAVFLSVAVLAAAGWFAWDKGQTVLQDLFTVPDYTGTGEGRVPIQVHDGDTTGDIAATLEEGGVVKSAEAFERAASKDSRALSIQPGYYQLRKEMSGASALSLILDPASRVQNTVTILEGQRLSRALDELSKETAIDEQEFEAVLKKPDSLGLPSYAEGNAEGFLFPATYDYDPGSTAETVLTQMVEKYDDEAARLDVVAGAKRLGYSPRDIMTVASIVQVEARHSADFPKVARVLYNRLDEDLWPTGLLQLDSTVSYANNKSGSVTTTQKERDLRDPYNTYWAEGLPPGPINSPGAEAIEAALHPAKGDWLYFVTVNLSTGKTKFATTLEQHNVYVQEFQQWCQNNSGQC